jgi:hypothetical protein
VRDLLGIRLRLADRRRQPCLQALRRDLSPANSSKNG